jgi:glycosyltransferase involved in cell wall biosynthesis
MGVLVGLRTLRVCYATRPTPPFFFLIPAIPIEPRNYYNQVRESGEEIPREPRQFVPVLEPPGVKYKEKLGTAGRCLGWLRTAGMNWNMNLQPELAPRVSVIVPVYNGERFLADAIDSILAQTYPSYEVILVDDGSTDQTARIALSYPSILYLNQANAGTAAARNRGVEIARGEFLAFLDADDLWMPDKLSLQMAAFEADPALEIVSGYVEQFVDPGIAPNLAKKYFVPAQTLPGYGTIAILIKRSAFDAIGPFHEDFMTSETISWFVDIIGKKHKIFMLPGVVARRRIHGKNAGIVNLDKKNHDMIRALKRSIDRNRTKNPS